MFGLVQIVPAREVPRRRLWLVFFSEPSPKHWWQALLRPGFRHVSAAAYYADQERWVHVNPNGRSLIVEVMRPDEFGGRYQQLLTDATLVLRFAGTDERRGMPTIGWCTGAIRALLGVRSRALSPFQLARHLLARGAEIVEVPETEQHGSDLRSSRDPARGPVRSAAA